MSFWITFREGLARKASSRLRSVRMLVLNMALAQASKSPLYLVSTVLITSG